MPDRKEKLLFDKVHSLGETQNNHYHLYLLDDYDGICYRVHCREKGSFEITRIDGAEEFSLKENVYSWNPETWYLFDGDYAPDQPDMEINIAMEEIFMSK